jgi:DNA polymerase-1
MCEWLGQGIWWVLDYSHCVSLFYNSYARDGGPRTIEENVLNPIRPTIDSVISTITWCLEKEPEMAFIALDSGNSERRKIYTEYKAFRERAPEYHACYADTLSDLKDNFGDVLQVVAADGWEADDVMASIARLAVEHGKKCIICSSDKDLRQCLRAGSVNMQIRTKDGLGRPDWGFFTADMAEASWGGLKVEQFIDYQILLGDDCDNIPGCDGIGEKTAVRLLKQYGSIAKMKEQTDEIPGKIGKALKEFWEIEPVVRKLVTLKTDVDFQNVEL